MSLAYETKNKLQPKRRGHLQAVICGLHINIQIKIPMAVHDIELFILV